MEITVSNEQGNAPVTVIRLVGKLDVNSYLLLQQKAEAALGAGAANLLIDLSGVSYMSSAGVRALNHVYRLLHQPSQKPAQPQAHQKSTRFKLLGPTRDVEDVLTMAGVDIFLEFHHDRQKAIASFG